jgi:hypothetical protein
VSPCDGTGHPAQCTKSEQESTGLLPAHTSTIRVLVWKVCKGSLCITFASNFDLDLSFCPCRPLARVAVTPYSSMSNPHLHSSYASCFWMALVTTDHFIRNDGIYCHSSMLCLAPHTYLVQSSLSSYTRRWSSSTCRSSHTKHSVADTALSSAYCVRAMLSLIRVQLS